MHPRALAMKRKNAQDRIVNSVQLLSERFGLNDEAVAVSTAGATMRRYPQVQAAAKDEAIADFLDRLVVAVSDIENVETSPVDAFYFIPISDERKQSLMDAGYTDLASLDEATDDELQEVDGIGPASVRAIRHAIERFYESDAESNDETDNEGSE